MLRSLVLGVALTTLPITSAEAQTWAEKLFAERAVDFGAVARAAKVEHRFIVENTLGKELHITGVRSSCGCTQPRVETDTVPPGGSTAVVAKFNTVGFTGQRRATVTVTFDRPQFAEVQIQVQGYIRTDIVLDPAAVNLGHVDAGQAVDKTVRLEYAGRSDWQITGIEATVPYLSAEVREASRSPGRASYEILVHLGEQAPAGHVADQLLVHTNDRKARQFPVLVEGLVVPQLAVSPGLLLLGQVSPGESTTRQLVVKGKQPFRITRIDGGDAALSFKYGDEPKAVHVVSVTWTAPLQPGRSEQTVTVHADTGCSASATIVGQATTPLAEK